MEAKDIKFPAFIRSSWCKLRINAQIYLPIYDIEKFKSELLSLTGSSSQNLQSFDFSLLYSDHEHLLIEEHDLYTALSSVNQSQEKTIAINVRERNGTSFHGTKQAKKLKIDNFQDIFEKKSEEKSKAKILEETKIGDNVDERNDTSPHEIKQAKNLKTDIAQDAAVQKKSEGKKQADILEKETAVINVRGMNNLILHKTKQAKKLRVDNAQDAIQKKSEEKKKADILGKKTAVINGRGINNLIFHKTKQAKKWKQNHAQDTVVRKESEKTKTDILGKRTMFKQDTANGNTKKAKDTSIDRKKSDDTLYTKQSRVFCAFCKLASTRKSVIKELGPFYGPFTDKGNRFYVHEFCALWTPNVYRDPKTKKFINLGEEIRRSNTLKCSFCGVSGGGLGCNIKACKKTYHFNCALDGDLNCKLDEATFSLLCPQHAEEDLCKSCCCFAKSGSLLTLAGGIRGILLERLFLFDIEFRREFF